MTEKLTNRIGLISVIFYTILFFIQITLQTFEVTFVLNIILFILNNICIIIFGSISIGENRKLIKVIKVLTIAIISDVLLIGTCLIVQGIKY